MSLFSKLFSKKEVPFEDSSEKTTSTSIKCPNCNGLLNVMPSRKKKCEHCGSYVYLRTNPESREKVLIKEDGVAEFDKHVREYYNEKHSAPIRSKNMDANSYALPTLNNYRSYEKQFNIKLKVKILVAGGDGACDNCKIQEGESFTVEEALKRMPLPHQGCTHNYGCRCVYVSEVIKE